MIPVLVLFAIALAIEPSFSFPLGGGGGGYADFDINTEFDIYSGPWNYGNRFWGGNGGFWGGSRGLGDGFVSEVDVDYGYTYGPPTRTIDVGRDRTVRDFQISETDNYISDRKTYRLPTRYQYVATSPRRIYSFGTPRISSIRTGGDFFRR